MAVSKITLLLGALGAFLSWIVAAQYNLILHLLPYGVLLGILLGVLGYICIQIYGSREPSLLGVDRRLPATSFLKSTRPEQFQSEIRALEAPGSSETLYQQLPASVAFSFEQTLALVLRQYVSTWLRKITNRSSFAKQVGNVIREATVAIVVAVTQQDLVRVMVTHALPIINDHLASFVEAERSVYGQSRHGLKTEEKDRDKDVELAAKYQSGKLHPAASMASSKSSVTQQRHLRNIVESFMPRVLPIVAIRSPSVRVVIREIVACAVLYPVLQLLSDPDFLFMQIESHGHLLLRQPLATLKQRPTSLRRRRLSDPNIGSKDLGKSASSSNSGRPGTKTSSKTATDTNFLKAESQQLSLRDTLYDVAGLSYFMEFMDRFELSPYVQFWITIDSLLASNATSPIFQTNQARNDRKLTIQDSDRALIDKINRKFLSLPSIQSITLHPQAIEDFLNAGISANVEQFQGACLTLSQAQDRVFREMEDIYFPAFQSSDLYRQWTGAAEPQISIQSNMTGSLTDELLQNATRSQGDSLKPPSTEKKPPLRKSAASSTDLTRDARKVALLGATRQSLDENNNRKPLFGSGDDEDSDTGSLMNSTRSLEHDNDGSRATANLENFSESDSGFFGSGRTSLDFRDELSDSDAGVPDSQKPSLDSLGLLGTPAKRTVFTSDDLFSERERLWEDDDSHDGTSERGEEEVREAIAGDLGLTEAIEVLNLEIEKLELQQRVLQGLFRKAELTNNTAELKILQKSVSELDKDLRRKELQRQQYVVQERDHSLYRKTMISIASVRHGKEADGHEYALYDVHVQRRASRDVPTASWTVTKRYSQFHELHRLLRHRFHYVREIPFPKRQVVATLQHDFVQRRRGALEQYLRNLLNDSAICRSLEFRAFLSAQPIRLSRLQQPTAETNKRDIISRIYSSLSEGLEDFVGNTAVLDQLSLAGQNLISAASATSIGSFAGAYRRANDAPTSTSVTSPTTTRPLPTEEPNSAEAQAEISALDPASQQDTADHTSKTSKQAQATTFIAPIATLFTNLFQLNTGNAWLRGRAIVIVLQQIMGGTVERRIREIFAALTTPQQLTQYIDNLREVLYPGGEPRPAPPVRSAAAKAKTRRDAEALVTALLVENTGSVLGRGQGRDAAKRLVRCLGNERLNRHLVYCLVDELVPVLLGESGSERR